MKMLAVSFLLLLHHTAHYADSSVVPPKDLKEPQAIPDASHHENSMNLAAPSSEPSRHNVALQDHAEERAAEVVDQPAAPRAARQLIFNDYVNLKWVQWTGSLPSGAVSIRNEYANRIDYICGESQCATGFYSPSLGAFCFYSHAGQEYRASMFSLLVNEDNFELLQWLQGSYGSFPANSISRCSGAAIFVGKNNYGLGKVIPEQRALLLPYKGYEYSYDYYEVLSLYTNYQTQKIANVRYLTNEARFDERSSQTLARSKVLNNVCQTMKKVVTVSKTTTIDQNWYIDRPSNRDVTTLLTTNIPTFAGTSMTLSEVEVVEWSEGVSRVKTMTHLRNVEINVPPNHSCEVLLQGKEISATVPYRATLTRFYHNAVERSTTIRGTFTNVQVDGVSVIVNQCQRIPNSAPC